MRVLFQFTVLVPIAMLALASVLIAIAYGPIKKAATTRVPITLNTGQAARRRLRRI